MKELMRRFLMWVSMRIFSLAEKIYTDSVGIVWQDRLRWRVERVGDWFFGLGYHGSQAELDGVYNGEIPPGQMNERQRAVLDQFSRADLSAHCIHCPWNGPLEKAKLDLCPECQEAVYIDAFEVEA